MGIAATGLNFAVTLPFSNWCPMRTSLDVRPSERAETSLVDKTAEWPAQFSDRMVGVLKLSAKPESIRTLSAASSSPITQSFSAKLSFVDTIVCHDDA